MFENSPLRWHHWIVPNASWMQSHSNPTNSIRTACHLCIQLDFVCTMCRLVWIFVAAQRMAALQIEMYRCRSLIYSSCGFMVLLNTNLRVFQIFLYLIDSTKHFLHEEETTGHSTYKVPLKCSRLFGVWRIFMHFLRLEIVKCQSRRVCQLWLVNRLDSFLFRLFSIGMRATKFRSMLGIWQLICFDFPYEVCCMYSLALTSNPCIQSYKSYVFCTVPDMVLGSRSVMPILISVNVSTTTMWLWLDDFNWNCNENRHFSNFVN